MPVKKTKTTKKDTKDTVVDTVVTKLTIKDHEAIDLFDKEGTHGGRFNKMIVTNLPGWADSVGDIKKTTEFRKYDTGTITMTVIGPLQEVATKWLTNDAGVVMQGNNGLDVYTDTDILDLRKPERVIVDGVKGTADNEIVAKLNTIDSQNLGAWVDLPDGKECSLWTKVLEIPLPRDKDLTTEDNSRSIFE